MGMNSLYYSVDWSANAPTKSSNSMVNQFTHESQLAFVSAVAQSAH